MFDIQENLVRVEFVDKNSGVYFLLHGSQVVYVGQSIDVAMRVLGHSRDTSKTFDSAHAIYFDKSELDVAESFFIHAFNPMYNGRRYNRVIEPHAPITKKCLVVPDHLNNMLFDLKFFAGFY